MTKHEVIISDRVRSMHARIAHLCLEEGKGMDTMRMLQIYSGIVSELLLEYENPGEAMCTFIGDMQSALGVCLRFHPFSTDGMPPIYIMDRDLEFGRSFVREITLDEWDDVDIVLRVIRDLIVYDIIIWEQAGLDRATSLNLFYECVKLGLAFEHAAQDLCDIVIDALIGKHAWTLADCICGLSGVSGQLISQYGLQPLPSGAYVDALDQVIFIMSQEAVRLGVPSGRDWRFGMAANDQPAHPPFELIDDVLPLCLDYMDKIKIRDTSHIAGLVAKAAGRMMAVAAGGEFPEVEPAIAKPLAMMAVTDSYRFEAQRKVGS